MIHIYEVLILYDYQKYRLIILFKFWIEEIDKIAQKEIYNGETNLLSFLMILYTRIRRDTMFKIFFYTERKNTFM